MILSKRLKLYLFLCFSVFSITACQNEPAVSVVAATPYPEEYIPTVIALTAEAAGLTAAEVTDEDSVPIATEPTRLPDETATQEIAQAPTETPLPTEENIVEEDPEVAPIRVNNAIISDSAIKIYRPGALSKLASPFRVVANLAPGPAPDYLVLVELMGEDGRLLVRKLVRASLPPGQTTVNFVADMEFEIRGVSELGRLVISVEDEFGRIRDLASMQVILLADGATDLNVYGDLLTDIHIQQPIPNVRIQDETVFVSGLARAEGDAALLLELVDEDGKVVGFGNASLIRSDGNEYGLFVGEISYNVSEPTTVRLIVKTQGERIQGITYLVSMEIVVTP